MRVLVADDDAAMRGLLADILGGMGLEVVCVADGLSAVARLAEGFDLVVTDLRMPKADGMEVLRHTRARWPAMPVIVLTAFGSIEGAVEAMRLGAFDYLRKPLPEPESLRDVVRRALAARAPRPAVPIVAVDPAMRRVVEMAERVAARDTTVLLLGESGTGKEVIARLLHEKSPRARGPFVAVNCAAIPEGLLESELFGHEKGAFTGAVARREGRFVQANGGTLLLDEVGETSAAVQVKLLRVLQERAFERVGGTARIEVDTRVVAATNRDLEAAIRQGTFREDLYYRIAAFPIRIPPLRERPEDILPLARHFLELLSRSPARTAPPLTEEACEAMRRHRWPGNVRELQNAIERAVVLSDGAPITPEMLGLGRAAAAGAAVKTLKEMERDAIEAALRAEGGNRRRAARRLGIALRTLHYKIKEHGLR